MACALRVRCRAISIHALRMEGDDIVFEPRGYNVISIHALRMEGDKDRYHETDYLDISIHALRMEGDKYRQSLIA